MWLESYLFIGLFYREMDFCIKFTENVLSFRTKFRVTLHYFGWGVQFSVNTVV